MRADATWGGGIHAAGHRHNHLPLARAGRSDAPFLPPAASSGSENLRHSKSAVEPNPSSDIRLMTVRDASLRTWTLTTPMIDRYHRIIRVSRRSSSIHRRCRSTKQFPDRSLLPDRRPRLARDPVSETDAVARTRALSFERACISPRGSERRRAPKRRRGQRNCKREEDEPHGTSRYPWHVEASALPYSSPHWRRVGDQEQHPVGIGLERTIFITPNLGRKKLE